MGLASRKCAGSSGKELVKELGHLVKRKTPRSFSRGRGKVNILKSQCIPRDKDLISRGKETFPVSCWGRSEKTVVKVSPISRPTKRLKFSYEIDASLSYRHSTEL